jgi:hypothetical protein
VELSHGLFTRDIVTKFLFSCFASPIVSRPSRSSWFNDLVAIKCGLKIVKLFVTWFSALPYCAVHSVPSILLRTFSNFVVLHSSLRVRVEFTPYKTTFKVIGLYIPCSEIKVQWKRLVPCCWSHVLGNKLPQNSGPVSFFFMATWCCAHRCCGARSIRMQSQSVTHST